MGTTTAKCGIEAGSTPSVAKPKRCSLAVRSNSIVAAALLRWVDKQMMTRPGITAVATHSAFLLRTDVPDRRGV